MTHSISEVLLVDPVDPGIRDGLSTPTPEAGEVVFLLVDEAAHEEGWPGRAAIAIARDWSAAGRRVILADADVTGASLHEQVGATNGEGVSDMVLYGASPSRVSRRPPGSGFLFMSAGTIVHEERSVYAHPRWPRLLGAFRDSGCVLVMYVPHPSESVRTLTAEGDRVYRLTALHQGSAEPEPAVESREATALEAEIAPEVDNEIDVEPDAAAIDDEPGPAGIVLGSVEGEDVSAHPWEFESVPLAGAERALEPPEDLDLATPQPTSTSPAPFTEGWSEGADARSAERAPRLFAFSASEKAAAPTRSLVNPLLLLVVFLLIIAAVLGAWLGYFSILGIAE